MAENASTEYRAGVAATLPPAEDQTATLTLLHDLGRDLTSILQRDLLIPRIAEQVRRLLDFQVFHLYLWDADLESLVNHSTVKVGSHIDVRRELTLGEGICGTAALERQPIRVADVSREQRRIECSTGLKVRSEMAVPLVVQDRLIGVIDVESTQRDAFSGHHQMILETLGASMAVALENAGLYEEIRRKERRMQADLQIARQVQQALLPNHSPLFDGIEIGRAYLPAQELGGDFYDFLSCRSDRLVLAVGDVSGKSTAAALHGSLAIGALRAQIAQSTCSPSRMLHLLNDHMGRSRLEGRFVAMALALYDSKQRQLFISNAGLPRPLLLRDGHVEEICVHGIPLGLFPDIQYDQEVLALQAGDIVVLCSDGLHESMDQGLEEFGSEGLARHLTLLADENAEDIAQSLLRAARQHSSGHGCRFRDDRTVVVLKATS